VSHTERHTGVLLLPAIGMFKNHPPTSSCGVTPIGHQYQLRPYSAALKRRGGEKPLDEEIEDEDEDEEVVVDKELKLMKRRRIFWTAKQTFMEYLHVTRGLPFADAEHISKSIHLLL